MSTAPVAKKLEWRKATVTDALKRTVTWGGFVGEMDENWMPFQIDDQRRSNHVLAGNGRVLLASRIPLRIPDEQYIFDSLEEAQAEAQRQLDAFVASIAEIGEK